MSDLHIEFERPKGPARPTAAWLGLRRLRENIPGHPQVGPLLEAFRNQAIDLVVMAGDIDVGLYGVRYADQVALFLGAPVVYVMGNHEGYSRRDLALLIPELRAAAQETNGRVTFLENGSMTLDQEGGRLHVLGSCCWTDYACNGAERVAEAMQSAAEGLNDHRYIRLNGERFSPEHARHWHETSRQWLEKEIHRLHASADEGDRILIVTHHAPVPDAVRPEERGTSLSPAYASDMTVEIRRWQPHAWIWGHTHYRMEARIGVTRLISAPRGYVCAKAEADTFQPALIELV